MMQLLESTRFTRGEGRPESPTETTKMFGSPEITKFGDLPVSATIVIAFSVLLLGSGLVPV
jgi:hypothetical protein